MTEGEPTIDSQTLGEITNALIEVDSLEELSARVGQFTPEELALVEKAISLGEPTEAELAFLGKDFGHRIAQRVMGRVQTQNPQADK